MDYEKLIDEKYERIEELEDEIDVLLDEAEALELEREVAAHARTAKRFKEVFEREGFSKDEAFQMAKTMFGAYLMKGESDDEDGTDCCDC